MALIALQLRFFASRLQRYERFGSVEQYQFEPQRNVRQGVGDLQKGYYYGRCQAAQEQLGRRRRCRLRLRGGRREWLLIDQLARQQQLPYIPGTGITADRPFANRQVLQKMEFSVLVTHQPVVQLPRDRKSEHFGAHQSLLGINFTRNNYNNYVCI